MKTIKKEIRKRVGSDFRPQQSQSAKQRMIDVLKSGGYCYRAPAFYINIKSESGIPTLAVDENADLLKHAFTMLSENKTLYEIYFFLKTKGIKLTKAQLEKIFANRVYIGEVYIPTHNGISGQWIKGLHQPIVDVQTFEIINSKMKNNESSNIPEVK